MTLNGLYLLWSYNVKNFYHSDQYTTILENYDVDLQKCLAEKILAMNNCNSNKTKNIQIKNECVKNCDDEKNATENCKNYPWEKTQCVKKEIENCKQNCINVQLNNNNDCEINYNKKY